MKWLRNLLFSFIIILIFFNIGYVQPLNQTEQKMILTFAWDYDPNTIVDGFNIYSRIQNGSYDPNTPTYEINGDLRRYKAPEQPLRNLWFVATAKGSGKESDYSNEVTNYPIPPYNFDMTVEYIIRFKKIE